MYCISLCTTTISFLHSSLFMYNTVLPFHNLSSSSPTFLPSSFPLLYLSTYLCAFFYLLLPSLPFLFPTTNIIFLYLSYSASFVSLHSSSIISLPSTDFLLYLLFHLLQPPVLSLCPRPPPPPSPASISHFYLLLLLLFLQDILHSLFSLLLQCLVVQFRHVSTERQPPPPPSPPSRGRRKAACHSPPTETQDEHELYEYLYETAVFAAAVPKASPATRVCITPNVRMEKSGR